MGKKRSKAVKTPAPGTKSGPGKALQRTASELSRQRHDNSDPLLSDIRQLIVEARQQTAQVVNVALTMTYWKIGDRIRREVLQEQRADYGKQIW